MDFRNRDEAFAVQVREALALDVARVLSEDAGAASSLGHRHLAARVRALVVAAALPLPGHEPAELLAGTRPLLAGLLALQNPSGLFAGGDNVDSPPDTAFSANDLADAAALLAVRDVHDHGREVHRRSMITEEVRAEIGAVLDTLTPPLLAGGVHTPNHRWELSAALARLLRLGPPPVLAEAVAGRIDQWLAEGVDVDADGLYSERSPHYAAAVSNPSLLLLATVLGRGDLFAVVERSLGAALDLLLPDGRVETVHSRRQDQKRTGVPLAAFLLPLRSVAVATGRADLAWAAELAAAQGLHTERSHDGLDGAAAASALLLDPRVGARLPVPQAPAPTRRRRFEHGPLVDHRPGAAVVVATNTDHAHHGRVRSGLATNPTVLRLLAGEAVIDSVRLSRTFCGLGPFRAQRVTGSDGDGDGDVTLSEQVAAGYHQPLPPAVRDADGAYAVEDEGRFSAAMAFGSRPRSEVRLSTTVEVTLTGTGALLAVDVTSAPAGAAVDWLLELALRPHPAGVLDGTRRLPDGRHRLAASPGARATWTVGGDTVVVEVLAASDGDGGLLAEPERVAAYEPGEEYGFLGGTDAVDGELVVLAGRTPARLRLRLDATPAVPAVPAVPATPVGGRGER